MSEPVSKAYTALDSALSDLMADETFQKVIDKHIHISHKKRLPDFAARIYASDQPKSHQLVAQGDFNIAWQICYELQIHKDCACFKDKLATVVSRFEQIADLLEQLKQLDN